jgi:hypothetical protein
VLLPAGALVPAGPRTWPAPSAPPDERPADVAGRPA